MLAYYCYLLYRKHVALKMLLNCLVVLYLQYALHCTRVGPTELHLQCMLSRTVHLACSLCKYDHVSNHFRMQKLI